MVRSVFLTGLVGTVALAGCAPPLPAAPSFGALPGERKTPRQFAAEDERCRYEADAANNFVSPSEGANQSAVGSALLGTALGAGVGALIGSAGGAAGAGAAIGGGTGLLAGSAIGGSNAAASGSALQANYDNTYARCMVAAGNKVPQPAAVAATYPPPAYVYPYPNAYAYPYPGYAYPYGYAPVAPPEAPTVVP